MRLSFLGATGTVTGSKYLVATPTTRVLVDCGLYQGVKQLRLRNWKHPPVDPKTLDAVVLTHAHLDHTGYLPILIREGFRGAVYCTPPTLELCRILLPDSGRIHEEDAAYANRKHFSRHSPALPLYTEADAERSLRHLRPLDFGAPLGIGDLEIRLQPAGHILGAASASIRHAGRTLLFSGDLGRSDDLLMHPPSDPGEPDWVVVESTYGGRCHAEVDPVECIAEVVTRTLEREGTVLMPSFAVGRAQTLLLCLDEAFRRGLPEVPVYLNSPMATSVTSLYERFAAYHRLSKERARSVCNLAHVVRSVEESRELTGRGRIPAVIVSASGMATGGRVLHHLKSLAPDPRNTILFPGFQAPGTRGEAITRGAESVKIHGQYVPIRAEVMQVDVLSAHADQADLVNWLGACRRPPRHVYVTHGDSLASDLLRHAVEERHQYRVTVPDYGDEVELPHHSSA